MKRLTDKTDYVLGTYSDMEERLMDIEDILGDEYDLDHLKELVQADREQMYMEPGFHINIQNGNGCFQSWWLRNKGNTKEGEQDG